jgi:hypothetical protein
MASFSMWPSVRTSSSRLAKAEFDNVALWAPELMGKAGSTSGIELALLCYWKGQAQERSAGFAPAQAAHDAQ